MFLDCAAGIAVNSTGHSHPDVVRAITDQAQRFLHMSGTDFYYDVQVRLAEELAEMVPIDGGARSFFANSGTEAVEACIKLARYATGRPNIIAFFGAFHGRTMGSLALTASKPVQRRGFGPFMSGVFHAPYADCYRCPVGLQAGELRSRVSRFHRPPAVHASHDAGGSGRHRRRADSGRGRVRRGTHAISRAIARADDAARHSFRCRRSAVRDGTHGAHVCDRARRRETRRDRHREGRSRPACRSASPWRAPIS